MAKRNPFDKYVGKEDWLQKSVWEYVLMQYKIKVIPLNTEGRKSAFERYKFKILGGHSAIPDTFIPVPRGKYCGLFIELKIHPVYKEDGSFYVRGKDHHKEQAEYLSMLNDFGYMAGFAIGFDEAKSMIDHYFKLGTRNYE